jgi:hypothetical protein
MASLPSKIERLSEDGEYPSFLSAEYANYIVDMYNAIRNMTMVGGEIKWADGNVVIRLNDNILNALTGSFITGSGSGSITIDRGDVWQ